MVIINTHCHGCNTPMRFEAVPVTLVEMTGKKVTHWGKATAAWICGVCRLDSAKLKAARLAAGLGEEPVLPISFVDEEEEQHA